MKLAGVFQLLLLTCSSLLAGQNPQDPTPAKTADNYSGMYSFLQDGEFVQITVEDEGRVTGFISRYGDSDSDRGAFLDQFFKQGKLDGTNSVSPRTSCTASGTNSREQSSADKVKHQQTKPITS